MKTLLQVNTKSNSNLISDFPKSKTLIDFSHRTRSNQKKWVEDTHLSSNRPLHASFEADTAVNLAGVSTVGVDETETKRGKEVM